LPKRGQASFRAGIATGFAWKSATGAAQNLGLMALREGSALGKKFRGKNNKSRSHT